METINSIELKYRSLVHSGEPPVKLFIGNPNLHGIHFPGEILSRCYDTYFRHQEFAPEPKGLQEARRAVADYYSDFHIKVDPDHIVLTSGTSESFFYLFNLLTQPGDNILAPLPAYPLFDHIAKINRIELKHYRLCEDKNWALDLPSLEAVTDHRTRAILLVSPNNPTGAVTTAEEIKWVLDWCHRKGLALICDEVFSEFFFGEGPFPRPMGFGDIPLTFTLNGISKMFALPGMKLGWIVTQGPTAQVEKTVDRLETLADTFLSCHIPIQKTLPKLFSEGKEFLIHYREEVQRRLQGVTEILRQFPELRWVKPQGGFYLMAGWPEADNGQEENWVIQLMEQTQVFVHPGYFYDYEKGIHFVISFLTRPDILQPALLKIGPYIKKVALPPGEGDSRS